MEKRINAPGWHGMERAHGARAPRLGLALCAIALALFALCFAFAAPAHAKEVGSEIGVSDDIARVHVTKLDADTHDYVSGATMAIIDKETGEVIDEWVTGAGTHAYEKGSLVVDRPYILREIAAPEGFSKVDDVEFVVNAKEGTGLTILSGTSGQFDLTESYKISLYDKADAIENEIVVTETTKPTTTPTSKTPAPKTGDETPISTVMVLVGIGIIAIIALEVLKRRIKE